MLCHVLLLLALFSTGFSCPDGSVEWQNYCYIFNATETGFAKAETICVKNGGHLVSIHDAFTNGLIGEYAPDYFTQSTSANFWIGLNSLGTKNSWEWMDGSNFDFNDWQKGEPQNSSDSQCASASMNDGYWKTESCFTAKPFVCGILNAVLSTTKSSLQTTSSRLPSTSPSIYPTISDCSTGWTYYEVTKSSYCANNASLTWQAGEDYCKSLGGHLTSIHSMEEDQFIYATMCFYDKAPWLGLHTIDNGTTYQWTDKSKLDFVNWDIHFPIIYKGACIFMYGYCFGDVGTFENTQCDADWPITICKK